MLDEGHEGLLFSDLGRKIINGLYFVRSCVN